MVLQESFEGSALLLLDTCAVAAAFPELELAGRFATVSASGSVHTWQSGHMVMPGGRYRLCWCAGESHGL